MKVRFEFLQFFKRKIPSYMTRFLNFVRNQMMRLRSEWGRAVCQSFTDQNLTHASSLPLCPEKPLRR